MKSTSDKSDKSHKTGMNIDIARNLANIEDLREQLKKFKVGDLFENDS